VPPSCLRTLGRERIEGAAGADRLGPRLAQEIHWNSDGRTVLVSMVAWVDHVRSADLEKDLDAWRRLLAQDIPLEDASETLRRHAAEGSRLIAWDFLIANWDRWSGSNTFRVGAGGPFVWLDNAAGFGHYAAGAKHRNEAQIARLERYSRSFVAALRAHPDGKLAEELAPAGLSPRELKQLFERREELLRRVDALVARLGEARVLCFE
jgi:hypothetical protein